MTRQIGAMAIEVLVQDPAAGPFDIEGVSAEVMSTAPTGPVQVDGIALEVMSTVPTPSVGTEQPRYLGRRRRITTNQVIT